MNALYFKAKMSSFVKQSTVLFYVVCVLASIWAYQHRSTSSFYTLIVILGLAAIVAFALRPLGYSLEERGIRIHRPCWSFLISYEKITSVYPLEQDPMRFFGICRVGNVWGSTGYYLSSRWNWTIVCITNREDAVVLRVGKRKMYLISPDHTEDFVQQTTQRLPLDKA